MKKFVFYCLILGFLSTTENKTGTLRLWGGTLTAASASGGGGGGFAPTDLSGLVLWLDGSDATKLYTDSGLTTLVTADGDPVGGWKDKSSSAQNFTQATGANRPTYKVAIKNGLSILRFDGLNDRLSKTMGALTTRTVFVVFMSTNPTSGAYGTLLVTAAGTGLYSYGAGGGTYKDNFYQSASLDHLSAAMATSTWNIFSIDVDGGANGNAYKNGVSYFSGSADASNTFADIGNDPFGDLFAGDIGEIIVYNRVLTGGEHTQVVSYLNTKWAP